MLSILDKPSTPWILLLISLIIPKHKDFIKELLKRYPTPWILLIASWAYFLFSPQDPGGWLWKKASKLLRGRPSRLYTATFTGGKAVLRAGRIIGKKIERIPAPGMESVSSSSEETNTLKIKILTEMTIQEVLAEVESLSSIPPANHRFGGQISIAVSLLNRIYSLKEGWTTINENDGVLISNMALEGLELPFVRGDGLITGCFTLSEVLSVIQNPFARKEWDGRFDQSHILEYLDPHSILLHSVQKGTFPVSPRDFLTVANFMFNKSGDILDYVATSVQDSAGPAPDSQGRVRAEILISGWRLQAKKEGIMVTYIVHVDVKGFVPSAIIKSIQTQTPMCINRINNYLSKLGPLPFLLSGSFSPHPLLQFSKRESTDQSFILEYSIIPSIYSVTSNEKEGTPSLEPKQAAVTIALPSRTFSNGAHITCKGLNSTFSGCLIKTEMVSTATSFVVQIWPSIACPETIPVEVKVIPGTDLTVKLNNTDLFYI